MFASGSYYPEKFVVLVLGFGRWDHGELCAAAAEAVLCVVVWHSIISGCAVLRLPKHEILNAQKSRKTKSLSGCRRPNASRVKGRTHDNVDNLSPPIKRAWMNVNSSRPRSLFTALSGTKQAGRGLVLPREAAFHTQQRIHFEPGWA